MQLVEAHDSRNYGQSDGSDSLSPPFPRLSLRMPEGMADSPELLPLDCELGPCTWPEWMHEYEVNQHFYQTVLLEGAYTPPSAEQMLLLGSPPPLALAPTLLSLEPEPSPLLPIKAHLRL